ncbi:MAG: hypothetical protein H0Z32_06565 [Bacillaceae bacterium]|nr:hypothetical protein [Bacillaceae bacterium]
MKKCLFIGLWSCLIILASCNQESYTSRLHHDHELFFHYKQLWSAPSPEPEITPITDSLAGRILGWYNQNWVLYERHLGEKTQVYKYHIKNGASELFFESNYPISQITPGEGYEFFAVESKGPEQNSIVTILNRKGDILLKQMNNVTQVDFVWSPYHSHQLLIIQYLPSMTTEVKMLNLTSPIEETVLDVQPYVQWYEEDRLAYFEWSNEPSFFAPVFLYDIKSQVKEPLLDDISVFASSRKHFMFLPGNLQDDKLAFYFYQKENPEELLEFQIEKLHSNSEYHWIPPFDWLPAENVFITFSPEHMGSLYDYDNQFNLIALQLESGTKEIITEVQTLSDINCSQLTSMCLVGSQYEKLINIENRKMYDILKN